MKRVKNIFLLLFTLIVLTQCSFVFDLLLENKSPEAIEIILPATLSEEQLKNVTKEKIIYWNHDAYKITLQAKKTLIIGRVYNTEIPDTTHLDISFLEIRRKNDTAQLTNKEEILKELQKIGKMDWRLLVK